MISNRLQEKNQTTQRVISGQVQTEQSPLKISQLLADLEVNNGLQCLWLNVHRAKVLPHHLHSALHISPILTLCPVLARTQVLWPGQWSFGPGRSLETRLQSQQHRRGRAAPSDTANSVAHQILAETESFKWLSSLSSCKPAGILTLLVAASAFPHSSLFL